MLFLIKLSENDKRLLIAICIVLILFFVLIGYVTVIVKKIMQKQGKRVDTYMYDLVKTKVVKDTKHFRRVAWKKSMRLFFKQAWIPVVLMASASLILLIFCLIKGERSLSFLFSPDEGFPTLLYLFDWNNIPKGEFFGITLPNDWPPILVTAAGRKCTPAFLYNNIYSWISYIVVPLFSVGAVWYLVTVQAYIARSYRIIKMSKDVFSKNLEKLAEDNNI